MSLLSEFKTGVVEFEIGDIKLPLKPLKEDKWKIIELQKDKALSEEKYLQLRETLAKIIKQGLEAKGETSTLEEIDNFLTQYEDEILIQLSVAFKWLTDAEVKELKKTLVDRLKKGILPKEEKQKSSSEQS